MHEQLEERIRELTSANEELRKQKEILQRIFDHIPIMIARPGADGRLTLVNRAWESTLGWTLEEVLSQNIDILREKYPDPEDLERALNFVATSSGEWVDFKTRVKDGRTIDTSWLVTRFEDGTNFATGLDISDRKRVEEALRDSEERFRQLAENIRELFWIKTPDFARVIYLSPSYERFTGRSAEGRYRDYGFEPFLAMIYAEDRERMAEIMRRADGKEFEIEFRLQMPDGSLRWIRDRGFPVRDQSGRVYRIAGIAENITERKLAEERVKATTEQLRALSASVQSAREEERARIAREIHDELGSGLTSLRWYLESLDKSFDGPVDQAQLRSVHEKTASMVNLTDTIINTVRRIASELRPSILDDIGLVDAIEWQAQQFQMRTGIACRCSHSLESAHLSEEQSTAIFRIFQEALTNILRHAQASRVDIAMDEEQQGFVLTIQDDGRGITEREKTHPLSLGLLGMQERAHLIGGRVDVNGHNGSGTVVTVRVPIEVTDGKYSDHR